MISIENVHQSFRSGFWLSRTEVLKGVSFSIPTRSVFGFLGPNGAGKTTLIHLITGMKRPMKGKLQLDGIDTFLPEAKARIGYLPERPYFHEFLTGDQLLTYFGSLSGMKRAQIKDRIPVVLQAVGMSHARHLELKKYSKGMLQRIGIAQAILHAPEFLVLDEPMSGLDPMGRAEIRELILQLSNEGHTIFFSSHVIPDVEAICNQVAIIRKGELVEAGPISKFLEHESAGVEIIFSDASPEKVLGGSLSELPVKQTPQGFLVNLPTSSSAQIIKKVLELSGRIHSVTRSDHPWRNSSND